MPSHRFRGCGQCTNDVAALSNHISELSTLRGLFATRGPIPVQFEGVFLLEPLLPVANNLPQASEEGCGDLFLPPAAGQVSSLASIPPLSLSESDRTREGGGSGWGGLPLSTSVRTEGGSKTAQFCRQTVTRMAAKGEYLRTSLMEAPLWCGMAACRLFRVRPGDFVLAGNKIALTVFPCCDSHAPAAPFP